MFIELLLLQGLRVQNDGSASSFRKVRKSSFRSACGLLYSIHSSHEPVIRVYGELIRSVAEAGPTVSCYHRRRGARHSRSSGLQPRRCYARVFEVSRQRRRVTLLDLRQKQRTGSYGKYAKCVINARSRALHEHAVGTTKPATKCSL